MNIINIPNNFIIKDVNKKYSDLTISGFPKKDVIQSFYQALINQNIESSCFWMAELHASNDLNSFFRKCFDYYIFYIHHNHPGGFFKLAKLYKEINVYFNNFVKKNIIESRNNQETRNSLANFISVLLSCEKNAELKLLKVTSLPNNLLDREYIVKNIKYQEVNLNPTLIDVNSTSKEYLIAFNEIYNEILYSKEIDIPHVLYWIIWLIKVEKQFKKEKVNIYYNIYQSKKSNIKDKCWIWFITNLIKIRSNSLYEDIDKKDIIAIIIIFKKFYKLANKIEYLHYIRYCLEIINMNRPQYKIENKTMINIQIVSKINFIYKQIDVKFKPNENEYNDYIKELLDNEYRREITLRKKFDKEYKKELNDLKEKELETKMKYLDPYKI
jgi:hypothetical protein